ncbi:MAG: exodeoxyribonuclease V subunit alpha [Desulfobacterales bacterium]
MRGTDLTALYRSGRLADIDVHFAGFIERLGGGGFSDVALAAALVSRAAGDGHVCIDLKQLAGAELLPAREGHPAVICPPAAEWGRHLESAPTVGRPGDRRPLILDSAGRLYLYRYFAYEQGLAAAIRRRTGGAVLPAGWNPAALCEALERLFPADGPAGDIDWQKIAALAVYLTGFCVITGGPGTGKTHTVATILALLIELADGAPLDILLAAPTGKAAARLGESLRSARGLLACRPQVREQIPVEARTIHRMLQPVSGTPFFRYNADNRLPADIVIVDEASMVDLALLAKLVAALGERTRLVLIGDKDQLASVEAGAVLGDICDRGRPHRYSPFFCRAVKQATGISLQSGHGGREDQNGRQDSIVNLVRSYRFGENSGIGALSRAVNRGDAAGALLLLKAGHGRDIHWNPVASPRELHRRLPPHLREGYRKSLAAGDPRRALAHFNRFRILCAVNRGFCGVAAINRLTEHVLRQARLITAGNNRHDGWYAGRPVLVTANDYRLGLFNGDIGLTVAADDAASQRLAVCFEAGGDDLRCFAVDRLQPPDTAFAMTVHKSQGSEFDYVHLILPDADGPILTRELIYTAVTRARSSVTIWGQEKVLAAAITRRIVRRSGLREALWGRTEAGDDLVEDTRPAPPPPQGPEPGAAVP